MKSPRPFVVSAVGLTLTTLLTFLLLLGLTPSPILTLALLFALSLCWCGGFALWKAALSPPTPSVLSRDLYSALDFLRNTGTELLEHFQRVDPSSARIYGELSLSDDEAGVPRVERSRFTLAGADIRVDPPRVEPKVLLELLEKGKGECGKLLEEGVGEGRLRDTLWAYHHLERALSGRGDLSSLPVPVYEEMDRLYRDLVLLWAESWAELYRDQPFHFRYLRQEAFARRIWGKG